MIPHSFEILSEKPDTSEYFTSNREEMSKEEAMRSV